MSAPTTVTYRKTGEKWVAFGPASMIPASGSVVVFKRDGSKVTETVTGRGKVFNVDGVECVYGYLAPKASSGSGSKSSGKRSGGFISHGSAETKRCWECGREFTKRDAKSNGGDWYDSYCGC